MSRQNKGIARRASIVLTLFALILGTVVPTMAQRRRAPRVRRSAPVTERVVQPRYYTVSADTVVRVRMNEKISSGSAKVGDRFTTTVVDPVYAGGVEVVPAGSIIHGRVTMVDRASRRSKAGSMGVKFVSIEMPNGATHSINGALTSLEADDVNVDNESEVEGRSATKRNAVFIGGGAATGALIGAIAGGGKGAGIGAGLGAGLGIAGSLYAKGKEAEVEPGTEFGVILNRAVTLPASNVR